jgi:hypothetical protein
MSKTGRVKNCECCGLPYDAFGVLCPTCRRTGCNQKAVDKGTKVFSADGFRAVYVAYRPDLGGHAVYMDDYRCTPGEQFVTAEVTRR